ncbi:hypothetical protein NN3_26420 [Nocardia neocaledoniensis NBRC 108232]|uniref:NIPSNAP protein n=2 Tax=Nocardia neocaledoniensis TaxID=236511 RepID=A0A317N5L9_9NOCA|nr:hypothetical protein DFR69_11326 [Nocardia neocaledoniensis]GEM31635.1 hypothetical protein NN3_26420 [Nocardia neocaledoniensis NBRC 108232]
MLGERAAVGPGRPGTVSRWAGTARRDRRGRAYRRWMDDVKVYVIDTVVTKPGRGKDFVDAYLRDYAPGARERGMVLERVVVSPPMWLTGESNTVTATWALDGAAGWWAMTWRGRGDEAVRRWWADAAKFVVERTRSTAAAVADIERLADV